MLSSIKNTAKVVCSEAAPKGYALDKTVHKFSDSGVTASDGYKIYRATSVETPLSDPVSLMLQKKSTTGLEAEAGDLEGAEFEVSYYDVDPQEVTNLSALKATGKAPLRTWVFKTDADGDLLYDDEHKVSGDELYYDQKNIPNVPIGAITFKELTAPTSGKYLVNEETFFTTITGTESSQVVDLEIIIPEVPANAGLTIQKSSEDKIVEDLWFRVESDNGYSNDFATNNLGSVSVNDLQVI